MENTNYTVLKNLKMKYLENTRKSMNKKRAERDV